MDDRLQRRLRDADPLTVTDRPLPDPARLDAIKERIMQTSDPIGAQEPIQPILGRRNRRRSIGLVAIGATALALVLVIGGLVRPSGTALAWDGRPTGISDAQKAAAEKVCRPELAPPPGAVVHQVPAGAVPPSLPTAVPPLVSLELHGNGGVAILSDGTQTGYCLVKRDGDQFALVAVSVWAGGGASLSVGGGDSGTTTNGGVSGAAVGDGTMDVTAMSTSSGGQSLGIIGGTTTNADAATVRIAGGPADGGTATVTDGHFALWVPFALGDQPIQLVALDGAGAELGRVTLFGAPVAPIEVRTETP